ncbi:MAG: PilC/PilY family type IV pilus protein [Pseudomonadota bacterium]
MAKKVVLATILSCLFVSPVWAFPPDAQDDEFSGTEDNDVTGNVLGNDTPAIGGSTLTVTSFDPPPVGSATISGTGNLVYTPPDHFSGQVTFQYEVKEENPLCNPLFGSPPSACFQTATIDVFVLPEADVPTIVVNPVVGDEDAPIPLDIDITPLDTDGSETIEIEISGLGPTEVLTPATPLGGGDWRVNEGDLGSLAYVPANQYAGPVTLTLSVTSIDDGIDADGDPLQVAASSASPLSVTVLPVADVPGITANDKIGSEDFPTVLDLNLSLLDNDGSESLDIQVSGVPTGASLSAGTNLGGGVYQVSAGDLPSLVMTLPDHENGVFAMSLDVEVTDSGFDEFGAPVTDVDSGSEPFTITILEINDDPQVVGGLTPIEVDEDADPIDVDLAGLFDDSDLPADTLTLTYVHTGADVFDALSIAGETLSMTFKAEANGVANIQLIATDIDGSNPATYDLPVTVDSINDAPVVLSGIGDFNVNEDAAPIVIDLNSVFDDVDITTASDTLSYTVVVVDPSIIASAIADFATGFFTITLAEHQFGQTDISIFATDIAGASTPTLTFNVEVDAVNDVPVAVDDNYSTGISEDPGTLVLDVLVNDDSGDSPTNIISVTQPGEHYILNQFGDIDTFIDGDVLIVDNKIEFTPYDDFWGTTSFEYTIEDSDGEQDVGMVTITIDSVNDEPTAANLDYTTGETADLNVSVAEGLLNGAYDIDPSRVDVDGNILDAQDLSVVINTFPDPAKGSIISSTSDGSFVFRPEPGFADDTATFTYQVFDNSLLSVEGTVSIFVAANPVVPAPPAPGEVAVLFNLSNTPLEQASSVEPNVLVSMDDSGSMDWHFIIDGATNGILRVDNSGIATANVRSWDYFYLWDLPTNNYDSAWYILPTQESLPAGADYATWRAWNHTFNVIYYDPEQRYVPWTGLDSSNNNFADANPTAIRLDPMNTSNLYDITTTQTLTINRMPTWDVNGGYTAWTSNNYYIPRYYEDDGTLVEILNDGSTYVGSTARSDCANPSACTYDEEIQNFANWFQYYRSREHVAKAGIGSVVADLKGIRVGYETINRRADEPIAEMNEYFWEGEKKELLDTIYAINSTGGTPLRRALDDAGRILSCSYSGKDCPALPAPEGICQQNFTLMFSDGYWNSASGTVTDNYDTNGVGDFDGGRYADSRSNTLADVAMYYYENDIQTGLANSVPLSQADINGVPDGTFAEGATMHQHMKTYTIAFGVEGDLNPELVEATDPATAISWPDPNSSSNGKIDDMLHAALNGRGRFLNAGSAQELRSAIETAFLEFTQAASSSSAATFNSTSLKEGTLLYRGFYDLRNRTGELSATEVDQSGVIAAGPTWTAAAQLDSKTPSSRIVVTYDDLSSTGTSFTYATMNANQRATLSEIQVNYLRGDRTQEDPAGPLRSRLINGGLLGDIVNSSPIFVGEPRAINRDQAPYPTGDLYSSFANSQYSRDKIVYVGANDGMLHGFDATTGEEKFAYVPNMIIDSTKTFSNKLESFTSTFYLHDYYVDLSPRLNDAYIKTSSGGSREWATTLVSGLGAGGKGYFALNVTDPATQFADVATAANAILWEFTDADDTYPNDVNGNPLGGSVGAITDPDGNPVKDLGYALSTPVVTMSNASTAGQKDWVAIFGNGPNSTAGIATLFVLFMDEGLDGWSSSDFRKISTGIGVPLTGEPLEGYPNGLGSPAAVDADLNGTVDYVYAGDRLGNLYRFDLTSGTPSEWKAVRIFTAYYEEGGTNQTVQPILSQPLVVQHPEKQGFLITFGTGSFIAEEDGGDTDIQSIYTIWDDLTPTNPITALANTRENRLVEQTMTNEVEDQDGLRTRRVHTNLAVEYNAGVNGTYGWYIDLDASRALYTIGGAANPDAGGNAPPGPQYPGERAIRRFLYRDGVILTTTVLPAINEVACFGSVPGALLIFDHLTGGDAIDPVIDFNNDGTIDHGDLVGGTEDGASGGLLYGTGEFGANGPDGQLTDLSTLSGTGGDDYVFVSGGNNTDPRKLKSVSDLKTGRLSWTEVEEE